MAKELIDEYIDRAAIESDTKFMIDSLNKVYQSFQKLDSLSVSFQGVKGSKELNNITKEAVEAQKLLETSTRQLLATQKAQLSVEAQQAKAREANAKATVAEAKAEDTNAKAKERAAKYTASLNKEQEKLNKERVKESERLGKLNNEYEQLKRQYLIAANTAKQLAAANGLNNTETKEAIAIAAKHYDSLIKIEKAVGQSQRQVGQYERASVALNNVLREAPAFANSFSTGISAISNNLPMLVDEYKKLRESLGSSFQAFKVLAGGLLSFNALLPLGFLLMQTYSKEIKSFFSELFAGKQKVDQLKESQLALNEAYKSTEFKQAIQSIDEMKNVIQLAKDGVIDKKRALDSYNEGLGQTIGKAKDLNEAEALIVKNGPAYINIMLAKAAANIALEKAAQKAVEAAELSRKKESEFAKAGDQATGITTFSLPGAGSFDAKEFDKQKKQAEKAQADRKAAAIKLKNDEIDAQKAIAADFNEKIKLIADDSKLNLTNLYLGNEGEDDKSDSKLKKRLEDQRKAAFEIRKKTIEDEITLQELITDNENGSFLLRSDAAKRVSNLKKQLAQEETKFALQEIEERAKEEGTTTAAYAQEILKIRIEGHEKEIEAETEFSASIIAIRQNIAQMAKKDAEDVIKLTEQQNKEILEKRVTAVNSAYAGQVSGIQDALSAELQIEQDRYKNGEITKEEFEARKAAVEAKYLDKSLQANIDYYKNLLKIADLPEKEREAALKKLEEIEDQQRKNNLQKEKDYLDKRSDLQKQYKDRVEALTKQAFSAFFEAMSFSSDAEKNRIQENIDALDAKKQKEIEVAEQTSRTEAEKADKIAVINAKAQAEKEKLERRQRQLDVEKAKLEKISALFNIGVTTAQDVFKIKAQAAVLLANPLTAPLAPLALAQIPFVIGSGALAAGLIAAKPIPKYFKGKTLADTYQGPAVVGDGGRSELIVRADGRIEETPDVPTLAYIGSKDVILPDAKKAFANAPMQQINKAIAYGGMMQQNVNFDASKLIDNNNKNFNRLIGVVRDSKPTVIHKGINRELLMKYGMNYTKYL